MPKREATATVAVKQEPEMGRLMFPAGDPRAGLYEPGVVYQVDRDKAEALVAGGGFVVVDEAPKGEDE